MGPLRLALLGRPEIWVGDRQVTLRTRKALALVAYLAAEGRPHPRDQLAALLWPELSAVSARNNVRLSLFYVRQALGSTILTTTGDMVACSRSALGAADIQQLALIEQRFPLKDSSAPTLAELAHATELYRSQFLDGLEVPDAPEFDAWLAGQRAYWQGVIIALLDCLATLHVNAGETTAARAALERLVILDPGTDVHWLRLLALDAQRGDDLGARRSVVTRHRALEDLGPVPTSGLRAAAAEMEEATTLRRTVALSAGGESGETSSRGTAPVRCAPELAILRRFVDCCRGGHLQAVALLGDAGSGKTGLASQFLEWVRMQDVDILTGRAFATEGTFPYAPLVDALRPRLERENAPDDLLGDLWLAELARLLPELRERYPDLPPPVSDASLAHGHMLEAMTRLGLALAAHRPLVLFLDDFQWADAATRDVVQYALRHWGDAKARILVLLAVRSEDLTMDRDLARWLSSLERESPVTRLELAIGTLGHASQAFAVADELHEPLSGHRVRLDWSDAPENAEFFGRAQELARLEQWLMGERCRLVALIGIGGIGKSALAATLGHRLASHFDAVVWRSLRSAPPLDEWLTSVISALAAEAVELPADSEERLAYLLRLFRERRCLLILDNLETVLEPGVSEGRYRNEYAGYGQLLQQVGGTAHQSCVLVTSRELPAELARGEQAIGPVRAFRLEGLGVDATRAMLHGHRLAGDLRAWSALVSHFGGNALALKMASQTIADLYDGDIAAFLGDVQESPGTVFGGVKRLLDDQVARLSTLERDLLYWLAIERGPVSLRQLLDALEPPAPRGDVLEALDALRRRSLMEPGSKGGTFTLQPVILEYACNLLVETCSGEIARRRAQTLMSHALVKATSEDYVRRTQERLIAAPLLARLAATIGSASAVEQRLTDLMASWRDPARSERGYGPGNVANLLRLLRGDLRGMDLSCLVVRQAYLQEVGAQDASLAGARLIDCALADAFYYPTSVALSADGTYLAAGTSQGEVRVWCRSSRGPTLAIRGHTGGVFGLAIAADARLVASGGLDGNVRIWDMLTGRLRGTISAGGVPVWSVSLSDNGLLVAAGTADGTFKVWTLATGQVAAAVAGHAGPVWGVALGADGQRLASVGADGLARLWDLHGSLPIATLRGHAGGVRSVALSTDCCLIATGGCDGTLKLWEAPSGRLLATLAGHAGHVCGVALSADGRLAATGSLDGTAKLWDVPGRRLLTTMLAHAGRVWGVALAADGRTMAGGTYDGTVKVWDAPKGQALATMQGHAGGIGCVAISADGRRVAGRGTDCIKVWDTAHGRLLTTLQGSAGGLHGMAMSADGRMLAVGARDGTIRLWNAASGRALGALRGQVGEAPAMALSAGGTLVSSSHDGPIFVWDVAAHCLLGTLQGHRGSVIDVAISEDGRLAAAGCENGTIAVWDLATAQLVNTFQGYDGSLRGIALSGDGQVAAGGGDGGTVSVWDVTRDLPLVTIPAHAAGVLGVGLSADGRLLASAGMDAAVKLWNPTTGQLLATLSGHAGAARAVALSADGRVVASGGAEGAVRLWDSAGKTQLRALQGDRRYERMDITGMTGISEAQRAALIELGAVEWIPSDKADGDETS